MRRGAAAVAACLLALACGIGAAQEAKPLAAPGVSMSPGDFLDWVGQHTKARWRQLYRDAPPAAPADRLRASFMLGAILADAHLAQQAGDAQRFKNANQDLINYSRVLGLGEKAAPGFLAAAKTAEREDWPAVRRQIAESQALIGKLLHDQRDEDLATLVDIGMWMRLFEITSAVVINDETIRDLSLCVGSVPMLSALKNRCDGLAEATRADESVVRLGGVLDLLERHWTDPEKRASRDIVKFTAEKLNFLMNRLTLQ